jgi:hypothetical protein
MRRSAVLVLLAVLATACVGNDSRDSEGERTTTTVVAGDDYTGQWPEDAEALVKKLIPGSATTAKIRCGNLEDEQGMCEATWKKPSGAECQAEYTFYATGSHLRSAYGGTLAVCTTTTWLYR